MTYLNKLLVLSLFLFTSLYAENKTDTNQSPLNPSFYSLNISINYIDWTKRTKEETHKKDFSYVELEGFAKWDRAEFYMFVDLENPADNYSDTSPDNKRYVLKPILDIKLFDTNFYLHVQDYMFYSKNFYVNNLVIGLAYKLETDFGLWVKPFIGSHIQKSTYYNGDNGYIGGWVFNYNFEVLDAKFSLSQWHEFEFNRNKNHYQLDDGTPIGDGKSSGVQGALCVWWHPMDEITTGIQYRYANHKLGYKGYHAGYIYSIKYNF